MRRRLALVTACVLIPLLAATGIAEPVVTAADAVAQDAEITTRRDQTDFIQISAEITETAWEVTLANGGKVAAKVTVRETFAGEWLVVDESARHLREGAFTAAWVVTVPAKGETVLRYRARVKQ